MTDTEKIKELQNVVNQLFIQSSLVTAKLEVTTAMVLGVYAEKMTEPDCKNIFSNYCIRLEEAQLDALSKLSPYLLDDEDDFSILKHKTQVLSSIQSLKLTLGVI